MNNRRVKRLRRSEDSSKLTSRPVAVETGNLQKIKTSEALEWNDDESRKLEDAIEMERKAHDLMWRLFDGNEKAAMREHLEGVIVHVKDTYGDDLRGLVDALKYSRQNVANAGEKTKRYTKGDEYETPEALHSPPHLEMLRTMEWMRDSDDINLHHALWFSTMMLFPAIKDWILTQPLSNKANCKFWIESRIGRSINDLLGPMSEGLTLEGWVRDLRAEYVALNGFASPQFQVRQIEEQEKKKKK